MRSYSSQKLVYKVLSPLHFSFHLLQGILSFFFTFSRVVVVFVLINPNSCAYNARNRTKRRSRSSSTVAMKRSRRRRFYSRSTFFCSLLYKFLIHRVIGGGEGGRVFLVPLICTVAAAAEVANAPLYSLERMKEQAKVRAFPLLFCFIFKKKRKGEPFDEDKSQKGKF